MRSMATQTEVNNNRNGNNRHSLPLNPEEMYIHKVQMISEAVQTNGGLNNGHLGPQHTASKLPGYKLQVYHIDSQTGNDTIQYSSMPPGARDHKSPSGHRHSHSRGHVHHHGSGHVHHHQSRPPSNSHGPQDHHHSPRHHRPKSDGKRLQKSRSDGHLLEDTRPVQRPSVSCEEESDKDMPELAPITDLERQMALQRASYSNTLPSSTHAKRPILKKQSTLPAQHTRFAEEDLEPDLGQKLSPLGSTSSLQDLIQDQPVPTTCYIDKSEKLIATSLWAEEQIKALEALPPITTDAIRTDTAIVYMGAPPPPEQKSPLQDLEERETSSAHSSLKSAGKKAKSVTLIAPCDVDGSDSGRGTSEDHKKHGIIESSREPIEEGKEAESVDLEEKTDDKKDDFEPNSPTLSGEDTVSLPCQTSDPIQSDSTSQKAKDEEEVKDNVSIASIKSSSDAVSSLSCSSMQADIKPQVASYQEEKFSSSEGKDSGGMMWSKVQGGGEVRRKRQAFEKMNEKPPTPPKPPELKKIEMEEVTEEKLYSDEDPTSQHLDSETVFNEKDSVISSSAIESERKDSVVSSESAEPEKEEPEKEEEEAEMEGQEEPEMEGQEEPEEEGQDEPEKEEERVDENIEKEEQQKDEKEPEEAKPAVPEALEPPAGFGDDSPNKRVVRVVQEEILAPELEFQEAKVEELPSLCSVQELEQVVREQPEIKAEEVKAEPEPEQRKSISPVGVASVASTSRSSVRSKSRSRSGSKERLLSKLADAANAPVTSHEEDEVEGK